ncbi:hypothetical protein HRbin02_00613 [Candidatus Calditenuaceae archaeon HR02]|nr:hypothetical protein HRbin02_00613 [Candidatus Calditenuaceae archaeon HR02]
MRSRVKGVVAVLLRDNAKASKVLEAFRRLDIQAIWVTAPEEIPLTVKVVVASMEEGLAIPAHLKILYVEDYRSHDCIALQAASSLGPNRPQTSLDVAIDPGRRLGVVYVVDGYVVKTHTYPSIDAFEEDCRMAVECLGNGRRLAFYIGYRPEALTHELVARLKKHYPTATILVLPDDGTGPEFKGLSPDEESALKIYFKATSENI